MKQLHVVRRLVPVGAKLAPLAGSADTAGALQGLAEVAGNLSDDDVEYVINACLDVTQIRDGGGFAPLRAQGQTMYPLELATLLQIAARVLQDNLSGFFAALPSVSSPEAGMVSTM